MAAAFAPHPKLKAARPSPYEEPAAAAGAGDGQYVEDEARRVYVGNLSYKLKWQELKDHFKQVGTVENARILTEDGTDWGRSRGVGIVRFSTEAEAQAAIARLNGSELEGRSLLVDAWTGSSGKWKTEKTETAGQVASQPKSALPNGQAIRPGDWICPACGDLQFARNAVCRNCGTGAGAKGGGKGAAAGKGKGFGGGRAQEVHGENLVYVGNLAYEVTWKELKDHMKQAGAVEYCRVLTEDGTDAGRSKGSGCVRYSTDAEVQQAISALAETELMGRKILVDRWTSGKAEPAAGS